MALDFAGVSLVANDPIGIRRAHSFIEVPWNEAETPWRDPTGPWKDNC
jgi:hypothetical protein